MKKRYDNEYVSIIEPKNDNRVYIDGKSKSLKKYFTKLKSDVYFGKIVSFKETSDGYFYEKLCDDTLYADYEVFTDKSVDSKFNREINRLYKIANSPRNLQKSYQREDELYSERKGIFKRNLIKYSGYGENLVLQFGTLVSLLFLGLVGKLFLNIPMVLASSIVLGRILYVLYKTIDTTNKELSEVESKTVYGSLQDKKDKEQKKEIKVKTKVETKKEVKEIKKEVKKTVTPRKNISNKELTLSYLKSEYRKLYLEREKMIKNNYSKEQIKLITDKMNEVGKRAFRIEMGEDKSFDKDMFMKLRK